MSPNTARQASDSIRGYGYQIWQSVFAWINLKSNEVLILEGSEDFELVSENSIEVTQVKDTSGNISLGVKSIRDAISNFWSLKKEHSNKKAIFRFLTTSNIGIERGNPFNGSPGLIIWDAARSDDQALEKIKNFLITENKLPAEIIDFIKNSDYQKIREGLILPIEWWANEKGIPSVGSSKVSSRLFREAFDVASKKENRLLTYSSCLQVFDDETRATIPKGTLSKIKQIASVLSKTPAITSENEALIFFESNSELFSPPPLFEEIITRPNIVNNFKRILEENNIVVISGSTGQGKTTIANLLIDEDRNKCFWFSYRGIKGSHIRLELEKTINYLWDKDIFILDDLGFEDDVNKYDHYLGGLMYSIIQKNKKVVITTQNQFPTNIKLQLNIASNSFQTVVPLEEFEIEEFLKTCGCPLSSKPDSWARIIFLRTFGHPLLVHAHLKSLKNRDRPIPSYHDLSEDPAEVEETVIQSSRLLNELTIPGAQDLIYRLSLYSGCFRRDHALKIGAIHPTINLLGTAFDSLVGPWIEKVEDNYYQISPLLKNTCSNVWSDSSITTLHNQLAYSIFQCTNFTLNEANAILFHGHKGGESDLPLMVIVKSLMNLDEKEFSEVAKNTIWLVFIGLIPGNKIYLNNPGLNLMLRLLQYKIAEQISQNSCLLIADNWASEIEELENGEPKDLSKVLHLTSKILYYKIKFSFTELINNILKLHTITIKPELNLPKFKIKFDPQSGQPIEGGVDHIVFLFQCILMRCDNFNDLREFFQVLDKIEQNEREIFFKNEEISDADFHELFDRIWINESKSNNPDWENGIMVFESVFQDSKKWGFQKVSSIALGCIGIIQDEYLNDPDAAEHTLKSGLSSFGQSFYLRDRLAQVFFRSDKFSEALSIWEPLLQEWPINWEEGDSASVMACRKAACCAAHMEDWELALRLL